MSLELLDAHETAAGIAATFGTDRGLLRLEGTPEEMARLARAMQEVAALGELGEYERVWMQDVPVGDVIVQVVLKPGGRARVRILPA